MSEPGLGLRFDVTIDGIEIGSFMKVDGLTVQYEVIEYKEGGENTYVHRLPGRMKYGNIKLTRPLDDVSVGLADWFGRLAEGKGQDRHTMSVVALNGNDEEVASWSIDGVWPVKYQGPSFDATGARVATESLELAHHGFFSEAGSGVGAAPPGAPTGMGLGLDGSAGVGRGGVEATGGVDVQGPAGLGAGAGAGAGLGL